MFIKNFFKSKKYGRVSKFLTVSCLTAGLAFGLSFASNSQTLPSSPQDAGIPSKSSKAPELDKNWQMIQTPDTKNGLVLNPCILGLNKPYLAWGWTNKESKILLPEFTFSVLNGETWSKPRPPFFGSDIGNVRRIALTTAKHSVGLIYQRTTQQDDDTYDVVYAISNDKGWSYTKPAVCDSFVHEERGGTAVDIAGVGGRQPALCFGWLSEARMVKVGLLDPHYQGDRPRANNVGRYAKGCERIQLCGENSGGFLAVWNEGTELRSTRIKPLVGTAQEDQQVVQSKIGLNFVLTDNEGKNPMLVFDLPRVRRGQGARRQVRTWKDNQWQVVEALAPTSGELPVPMSIEATQDKDNNLHVVSLERNSSRITYSKLVNGRFTEPETAIVLKPMIGVTGMDICASGDYIYVVASQGPYALISKRKISK